MSNKIVSFIIPTYNAADTIVRCLDSIRNLSLDKEEYEIIVIDDYSTDETIRIVEDYAKSLNSFLDSSRTIVSLTPSFVNSLQVLRQPENHRQGAARNRGVSVAKGEYICFVDADDAVAEGIVNAIRMAKEKNADMVALHYALCNEHGSITSEAQKLSFAEGVSFSGIEMQNKHSYWCSAPWGYIYSKVFLQKVNYPFLEDVLFEDSDFVAVHLYHAKRMAYSPELGYKAYYREGSTTRHTSYKNVADYLLLGVRMMRFYERIMNEREKELMSEGVNELMSEREKFAEGILEGACWNVQKSCRRLIKLGGIKEVRAYYERINEYANLNEIYTDVRYRKYYWNIWTSLCVGHRKLSMMILAVLIPVYKLVKR